MSKGEAVREPRLSGATEKTFQKDKKTLDKAKKVWYNKSTSKESERLEASATFKNLKKALDKPVRVWYNQEGAKSSNLSPKKIERFEKRA